MTGHGREPRSWVGIAAGKLDQFESVFRAAARQVFQHQPVTIDRVMVVSDQDRPQADLLGRQVADYLGVLGDRIRWRVVHGEEFSTVPALLGLVEEERPDLICTYRHLHSESWKWPYTLGEYVDVLTQATTPPVMVLPHPSARRASDHALRHTRTVMAITDHLTGDARLVNHAAHFTERGGTLFLTHVENQSTFERYIDIISKIPSIDTEVARQDILDRLLREPTDYIRSCRAALRSAGVGLTLEEIVVVGRRLREYEQLIEKHEVDLLVFNTKDEDQMAMHGLGYPLAVELRQIPLLML